MNKQEKVHKFTSAKMLLTTMLPDDIHYGHTIDEAEQQDALSDVVEDYAKQQALNFLEFIEVNGFTRLEDSEEYSNGEVHRTRSEIYEMYLDSKD